MRAKQLSFQNFPVKGVLNGLHNLITHAIVPFKESLARMMKAAWGASAATRSRTDTYCGHRWNFHSRCHARSALPHEKEHRSTTGSDGCAGDSRTIQSRGRGLVVAVRKFRSVADMPGPPPREPLDAENLRLAFGLMEFANRLNCKRRAPGLRKFRSYEEAKQSHDRATR